MVHYRPQGAVLVTGPAARVLPHVQALSAVRGLRIVAVVSGGSGDTPRLPRTVSVVPGRVVGVAGCLGRFSARASADSGPVDLSPLSPNRNGLFDLVVDLNSPRLWPTEVTPLGYFTPGDASGASETLRRDITALSSGETVKPQYVRYVAAACTHSAQGITGCTRCLDACPAGAITTAGTTIAVDTGLCRGCGSCTVICPTGALACTSPKPAELRALVRQMLDAFHDAGGTGARIVFHEGDAEAVIATWPEPHADARALFVEVPAVASVGPETWFAVLALGASEIIVLVPREMPATARRVLRDEVAVACDVLGALGTSRDRLSAVGETAGIGGSLADEVALRPVALPPPGTGKRAVIEWALGGLAGPAAVEGSRTELPPGAPLGRVEVDGTSCTLCLACTRLCPTSALVGDLATGELKFLEGRCVQCGLCEAGCPENAIRLQPSIGADTAGRLLPRILHNAELAACTRCGKPFLPLALLQASLAHLGGAEVTGNEEVSRVLRVCPRCRSEATMNAPFVGGAGPSG